MLQLFNLYGVLNVKRLEIGNVKIFQLYCVYDIMRVHQMGVNREVETNLKLNNRLHPSPPGPPAVQQPLLR